jgi:hypothetical protein
MRLIVVVDAMATKYNTSEEQGSMKVEPNRSKKRCEHRLPTVEGMGSHVVIFTIILTSQRMA